MKFFYKMSKRAIFGLLLWPMGAFAYTTFDSEARDYPYFVGEDIVLRIPSEIAYEFDGAYRCLAAGEKKSSFEAVVAFNGGQTPFSFTVKQCQNYYDPEDSQYYWNWHNRQNFWMELVAQANKPGSFSGSFVIKKNGRESAPVPFSFTVENHNGVALMFADSAASYNKQIEINEYVLNNSQNTLNLQDSYIDYYLKKTRNSVPQFDVWYSPGETCHEIYICDNEEYIVRQRLLGNWEFPPTGQPIETAQIGYQENPSTYTPIEGDKTEPDRWSIAAGASIYGDLDYSYTISVIDQRLTAFQRHAHINGQIVMRSSDGTVLLGNPPTGGSYSNCRLATYGVDYQSVSYNQYKSYWCSEKVVPQDVIYEGEDYFAMPEMPNVDGIRLELVADDASSAAFVNMLEIGTPADYWSGDYDNLHNNNVNTEKNRKVVYVRSKHGMVRGNRTIAPGTYKYRINVINANSGSILSSIPRTVVVKKGAQHPKASGKNIAVLMGDETWFKKYQLDIASGLVNFSDRNVTLKNFQYDYYGKVNQKELINGASSLTGSRYQPHYWYSHNGYDVTFKDCGNGYFRLRYKYAGQITINANYTAFDNKAGFVYSTGSVMNKNDDYSMSYWNGEISNRRRYSPYTPLYNDGTLIWGEVPSWAHSCEDGPSIINPNPGTDNPLPSSSGSVVVDVPSSFNAFRDLAVRYVDNMGGNQSEIPIYFDIKNKGNQEVSLDGYTVRFYYNDTETGDASALNMALYYSGDYRYGAGIFDGMPSTQKCAVGKYAVDFKFSDKAVIAAGESFPQSNVQSVLFDPSYLKKFNKNDIASWQDSKTLTENINMVLMDKKGNVIYGRPAWECNGYTEKELKLKVVEVINTDYSDKLGGEVGHVKLKITNVGDLDYAEPLYASFYVTHGSGQVPVISFNNQNTIIATANTTGTFNNKISVVRLSANNKHTFLFTLPNGLKSNETKEVEFWLSDACLKDCSDKDKNLFVWDFSDDWSATEGFANTWTEVPTKRVVVTNSKGDILYGKADKSAPVADVAKASGSGEPEPLKQQRADIDAMRANRTDAAAYSGGQLLSGGDFEDDYLHGWTVLSGEAANVRGTCPQGSRYLSLAANSKISQEISLVSREVLRDSGVTLTFWASGYVKVVFAGSVMGFSSKSDWTYQSMFFSADLFKDNSSLEFSFETEGGVKLDDAVLVPGVAKPVTYATRFTNMANEEIESRAYDGDKEQLVTTSERDAMGRLSKKYLPYAMPCDGTTQCNSDIKSLYNPSTAKNYYVADNPDYPDAGNLPFVETKWKPDPMATKDVEGAPGAAFSIAGGKLVRAYSSGVNLSGIELLDSVSLDSAVKAVYNSRDYDGGANYHAARDVDPTHLWELNMDQNGHQAFTVKDGEGLVIVSGSLNDDNSLASRTVNEYDSRGNLVKSHPPMSCEYSENLNAPNCVKPTIYHYDGESRVIKSEEPDAGVTLTYYDVAGRVRATQTQNQIGKSASIVGYDHLDRTVYTGEWATTMGESQLRDFFNDASNLNLPGGDDLVLGTVTRTYYDKMPDCDILGVKLCPDGMGKDDFHYLRGRVAAVVSDVRAEKLDDGTPVKATDGSDSVVRVSTSNDYDKYGRVLATYTYDPTMAADSLRMLAVKNEYDLGGKLLSSTSYPYGLTQGGVYRSIRTNNSYDRLGRIEHINVDYGYSAPSQPLAHYEYYPTGSVKRVTLGNSIALDYTYHISGAVKTAVAKNLADNSMLFAETLYYEDCGTAGCTPQYNGNISRMAHEMAVEGGKNRTSDYVYDFMNRLTDVDDSEQDEFDEYFAYDAQGRITAQRRGANVNNKSGGEYVYYSGTNKLKSVANGMGGSADKRDMSASDNFEYDADGNMTNDNSKDLTIAYDWRGMPVEFKRFRCTTKGSTVCDSVKLVMAYDGSGRRISKTRLRRDLGASDWAVENVTHYTGIGTEVRENYFGGALDNAKVVVNMPQGLGRYMPEDAEKTALSTATRDENGRPTSWSVFNPKFEWYLKNHLGSTMLVYGTGDGAGSVKAAYDYRAFGEQVDLTMPTDKVTENFTGKEKDDETELNYFGARYLDPMLGMWISVDPKRQFSSPYLYAGNGMNPVNGVDGDGNVFVDDAGKALYQKALNNNFWGNKDIENAYRFANETKTEISIEHKGVIRNGPIETLAGKTIPGLLDQVAVFLHLADDNRTLNSARVQLSETGTENWSATLGISFDEAEARIATHEFEAHIRNFTPYADESGKHPVDIEHDKINGIEKRLFPE